MVSTIRWIFAGVAVVAAFVTGLACNALLDNQGGTLFAADAGTDGTGADVDNPSSDEDADTAEGCPTGKKACFGTCVDVLSWEFGCTDPTTCNACSFAHATAFQSCPSGQCGIAACNTGYGDCNTDASDGCEANLTSSSSCGSCAKRCSGGTPFCTPSGDGGYDC